MGHSPSRRHVKGHKQEAWEKRIGEHQSNEKPPNISLSERACKLRLEDRKVLTARMPAQQPKFNRVWDHSCLDTLLSSFGLESTSLSPWGSIRFQITLRINNAFVWLAGSGEELDRDLETLWFILASYHAHHRRHRPTSKFFLESPTNHFFEVTSPVLLSLTRAAQNFCLLPNRETPPTLPNSIL